MRTRCDKFAFASHSHRYFENSSHSHRTCIIKISVAFSHLSHSHNANLCERFTRTAPNFNLSNLEGQGSFPLTKVWSLCEWCRIRRNSDEFNLTLNSSSRNALCPTNSPRHRITILEMHVFRRIRPDFELYF